MDPIDDPRDAALFTLARLARLMGADLVVGKDYDAMERFEAMVRRQLEATILDGCTPDRAEQDHTFINALIEAALLLIRGQWLLAQKAAGKPDGPPSKMN